MHLSHLHTDIPLIQIIHSQKLVNYTYPTRIFHSMINMKHKKGLGTLILL